MFADEKAEKLVDLIYDAAIDNDIWRDVLTRIADATGSEGGVLFGQSWRAKAVYFDVNARLSQECNDAYQQRHIDNPWNRHMSRQPAGAIVFSDDFFSLTDLLRTAFYDEVLRPQNVGHNAMIPLVSRDGFQAAFNICRTNSQGPFAETERRILTPLIPHMKRSVSLGLRSNAYHAVSRAAFDVVDRLPDGVVMLDKKMRTIYANPAARLIESTGALALWPSPGCVDAGIAARIQKLVCNAVRGASGALSFSAPFRTQGMLTLLATALRGQISERLEESHLHDPAVLVFVVDIAKRRQMALEHMRQAFGLTRSEARVAIAVGGGASVTQLAGVMNLSPNTVKSHLRNVFSKTATQRQSELARLVSTLDSINLCP